MVLGDGRLDAFDWCLFLLSPLLPTDNALERRRRLQEPSALGVSIRVTGILGHYLCGRYRKSERHQIYRTRQFDENTKLTTST